MERAAISLGLITCTAEVVRNEAMRCESICRRFDPIGAAVISTKVLEGFGDFQTDVQSVFGNRPLWSGGDPSEVPTAAGLNLYRWLSLARRRVSIAQPDRGHMLIASNGMLNAQTAKSSCRAVCSAPCRLTATDLESGDGSNMMFALADRPTRA